MKSFNFNFWHHKLARRLSIRPSFAGDLIKFGVSPGLRCPFPRVEHDEPDSTQQAQIRRVLADRRDAAIERCRPFFQPRGSGRGAP
jgi:hypothetical protein